MKKYTQLSYDERIKIAQMRQAKMSPTLIAERLGRDRSTVYRELSRNQAPPGEYWPDTAQQLTAGRRLRGSCLDHDEDLKSFVLAKLCNYSWTPEQIAGFLKARQRKLRKVSHETIYSWIYQPAQQKDKLWQCLPRHKAKRGLRKSRTAGVSSIPNRVSIHERPKIAKKTKIFGHWEGNLMSFMKNSQHMLVLREHKTFFIKCIPLPSKKSLDTAVSLIALMRTIPSNARLTLTIDNGGEFAAHAQWREELALPSYFCDPYSSWQKGGVENTNGRLRRFLPRSTNIHDMSPEVFNAIIDNYNNTPRKALGWLTPLQAFQKNLQRVALQT